MDKPEFTTVLNKKLGQAGFVKKAAKMALGGQPEIRIKNASGSLKSLILYYLIANAGIKPLIIAPGKSEAEDWGHDLSLLMGENRIAFLSGRKKAGFTGIENSAGLMGGLAFMAKQDSLAAVASPEILSASLPRRDYMESSKITLKKGQVINFEDFVKNLALQGFERKEFVAAQGDMAVRGGILDIFPIGWDNPARLEFWGDEIDSIREFGPLSQRSIREHETIEFIAKVFQGGEDEEYGNIFEYLGPDDFIVIDSPEAIEQEIGEMALPGNYRRIILNPLGKCDIEIKSSPQPDFGSSVERLGSELSYLASHGVSATLCADGKIHLGRFKELVENSLTIGGESDNGTEPDILPDELISSIEWLPQTFSKGFKFLGAGIACFTEHEVFGRLRPRDSGRKEGKEAGFTLRQIKQLHIGDYVVHDDKGVAKFDGFESIQMGGSMQDCVRLIFSGGDKLYVHLNYIHKIRKYSAQEGSLPKLSKLGSTEWARKKARAKKKLKDIARELIKLYAERKSQPGFRFPADSFWQKEFEASFIYEDTPDQSKTTDEIKGDMESPTPMDRLVCGDVGFGKTELAIRAAFKAAQSGKQVAVLVPTTILAQQHFISFNDRLRRYPVNIEALSRFRSKKRQKEILENTKSGKVDILIGTHRLLSKDVAFKELGLLVIDEEHRFGVGAKEKLRQLRANIDTLTLTATPIPRTLNFSLMGARDLSLIETPPRNRLPVETEIIEWAEEKIKDAIYYEIGRGGQAFFVTDKVMDIEKLHMNLKMSMPDIKFAVAHGQMKTSDLESVMDKFIEKKFDVLISTKIVESGLDIPNANTIFINRPQNFGLAELYQLRGRVGRSNSQAYCYLIIPPVRTLTSNTLKRLQAIEEFTDLGSGFQLALRDMEIRGAGNLLGPEQSGYINEMGFDMFQKILDEAVQELRAEEFRDLFQDSEVSELSLLVNPDLAIELDTDALLPSRYIQSETVRYAIYKRLYDVRENKGLQEIIEEMKDRFGNLPKEAQELVFAVKIRIAALPLGFEKISLKGNLVNIEFPPESKKLFYDIAFNEIVEFAKELANARLNQKGKKLTLDIEIGKREEIIEILWKLNKNIEMAVE